MTHFPYFIPHGRRLDQRSLASSKQQGFTLVELLVAVALGLLLMVALVAVFLNVSRTNNEMTKTNSLIENGRFAIDILQEDIEHAGFWGGYVPLFDDLSSSAAPTDAPTVSPSPCLDYASWTPAVKDAFIGIPVQSYTDVPSGCSTLITNRQANTDVLVVRYAGLCMPGETNCEAAASDKVYFQSSFCETQIGAGDRYVLSTTPESTATFTMTRKDCTTASTIRKYVSNIYYVRSYAVTPGDGIPTLMRSSFGTGGVPETPVALIEGIEAFSVELGIDAVNRCGTANNYAVANVTATKVNPSTCTVDAVVTNNTLPGNRGDGVPEMPFVHCSGSAGCTNVQLRDVVAAKVYVLARSPDKALGYSDTKTYALGSTTYTPSSSLLGYKRHVFETTVRMTNVSGRRETP